MGRRSMRWYGLVASACRAALRPRGTPEGCTLGAILFGVTLPFQAFIVGYMIPHFWERHATDPSFTLSMAVFFTVFYILLSLGVVGTWGVIWSMAMMGPWITAWPGIFRETTRQLSIDNLHLLPAKQFDKLFKQVGCGEEIQPLLSQFLQTEPPLGTQLTPKDLAGCLLAPDKKLRIQAISFATKLAANGPETSHKRAKAVTGPA